MEQYLAIKKERHTGRCYHMDETGKHAERKKSVMKSHAWCNYVHVEGLEQKSPWKQKLDLWFPEAVRQGVRDEE